MNPLTQSKSTTILSVLIALTFACFALAPQARATCQDACLTNQNTVLGDEALFNNTDGSYNTATGAQALQNNTTGGNNTAIGAQALIYNTTGSNNTAIGYQALILNNGNQNTATGVYALVFNTTGFNNTANGFQALVNNTTGNSNTATGNNALLNNTSGSNNIALGDSAGVNLMTGSNNIDIGSKGQAGESKTIRIGKQGTQTKTVIAGISGTTVAGGIGVVIDSNGRLGTTTSSSRFKDEIKPMDKSSEVILALKPVTFHYKKELDPEGVPQFGLVAEQVEKVNPALVARDEQGKAYTVRYEAVNAMLLNEFIKEHRKNEAQQKQIEALTAMVKEQASQIQKVNARLEVSKPAPRTVLNNQ